MTERLFESGAYQSEYECALRVERAITDIWDATKDYTVMTFAAQDEANAAAEECMSVCQAILAKCPEMKDTALSASGDGVKVLNWQYNVDEDGQVTPYIDRKQLFVAQPFYENKLFTLMSVNSGLSHNEEKNMWFLAPYLQGKDLYPTPLSVDTPSDMPLMIINVEATLIIPCAVDNARVDVIMLAEDRLRLEAVEALARAIDSSEYPVVDKVQIVNQILQLDVDEFVDFQPLDLLHELGQHSIEFARFSAKKADALNDALAATFGAGRAVRFTGGWHRQQDDGSMKEEEIKEQSVELVTIVTEMPAISTQGPAFVVNYHHPDDTVSLCYVPFEKISAMKV